MFLMRQGLKKALCKTPKVQEEGWSILNSLSGVYDGAKKYLNRWLDNFNKTRKVLRSMAQTARDVHTGVSLFSRLS